MLVRVPKFNGTVPKIVDFNDNDSHFSSYMVQVAINCVKVSTVLTVLS